MLAPFNHPGRTPMNSAVTPHVTSLATPKDILIRPASAAGSTPASSRLGIVDLGRAYRPQTAGAASPPKYEYRDDDVTHVLLMHCCAVAALSSKLPSDADVTADALKHSMKLFEATARKRVRAVAHLTPVHALSTLTQLFIFEGLSCRETQEAHQDAQRQKEMDILKKANRDLEARLAEAQQEAQALREAMLQVQTAANRQVLDARDQNTLLARDAQAQSAELRKLSAYCEKLKAELDAQARSERHSFDLKDDGAPQRRGGAGAVGQKPLIPNSRATGGAGALHTGLNATDKEDEWLPPIVVEDEVEQIPNSAVPLAFAVDTRRDSMLTDGHSPVQTRSALRSPKVVLGRAQSKVGFTPANRSVAKPVFGMSRADMLRRSVAMPHTPMSTVTDDDYGGIDVMAAKVPAVPTDDYTEAVYMYLGGTPDKHGKLDPHVVKQHLERTYDNLGDTERFARLLRRYKTISLTELGLILLQLAKV